MDTKLQVNLKWLYLIDKDEIVYLKVYEYYDEPVIYLIELEDNQKMIGILQSEDPKEYLYIPVTEERIKQLETSQIDLRNIILDCEYLFCITAKINRNARNDIRFIRPSNVDGLPDEGYFFGDEITSGNK